MTYSMNTQLIERFRRKISDKNGLGFSDPELQDLYDEAGGVFDKAVLLAWEELAASTVRFADYVQNETQEKKSQIFDHIVNKLIPLWREKIKTSNQVRIVGTKPVPSRVRSRPSTDADFYDDEPLSRLWG